MHTRKIAVIGLGYVGLPVAVHLGMKNKVFGFDINSRRIDELKKGKDNTLEVEDDLLIKTNVLYTCHLEEIRSADFFIVTVPTPVDDAKTPDLTPMIKASESVGKVLKKGDIVVYESTVYPGVCEDICIPILEKFSGLKGGIDFKIGYSPERINPGDKEHTFTKIKKVVSAQDKESLDIVANVYSSVVTAGIFKASSIVIPPFSKTISDIIEVDAIAEPQPKVCHLQSTILSPLGSTVIQTPISSPQAGLPTLPTPLTLNLPSSPCFKIFLGLKK